MTHAMIALAERCEGASGPDRELDWVIYEAFGSPVVALPQSATVGDLRVTWAPFYTASLDVAMTLVPEGWNWMAGNRNQPVARAYVENSEPAFEGIGTRPNPRRQWFEVVAATPALALTAAALRAHAAKEGE